MSACHWRCVCVCMHARHHKTDLLVSCCIQTHCCLGEPRMNHLTTAEISFEVLASASAGHLLSPTMASTPQSFRMEKLPLPWCACSSQSAILKSHEHLTPLYSFKPTTVTNQTKFQHLHQRWSQHKVDNFEFECLHSIF